MACELTRVLCGFAVGRFAGFVGRVLVRLGVAAGRVWSSGADESGTERDRADHTPSNEGACHCSCRNRSAHQNCLSDVDNRPHDGIEPNDDIPV